MNMPVNAPSASLIENLSNADYHARSEFSSSQIKDMLRSPAHFYVKHLDPQRGEKSAPTKDMKLGSLVHTLLLEPDQFESEYAISKKFDRRTKQGKADAQAFEIANVGKTIIDVESKALAESIADSVFCHKLYSDLTQGNYCKFEDSIFFQSAGLNLRVRPDIHIPPCANYPNGLIIDLKTTDDARNFAFSRTCANYRYDLSAAMYQRGMKAFYQTEGLAPFYFVVAERSAPFNCIAYEASDSFLDKGTEALDNALIKLNECLTLDEWDGYTTELNTIDL